MITVGLAIAIALSTFLIGLGMGMMLFGKKMKKEASVVMREHSDTVSVNTISKAQLDMRPVWVAASKRASYQLFRTEDDKLLLERTWLDTNKKDFLKMKTLEEINKVGISHASNTTEEVIKEIILFLTKVKREKIIEEREL